MTSDPRILRLKTPEACEQFAINVEKRGQPHPGDQQHHERDAEERNGEQDGGIDRWHAGRA